MATVFLFKQNPHRKADGPRLLDVERNLISLWLVYATSSTYLLLHKACTHRAAGLRGMRTFDFNSNAQRIPAPLSRSVRMVVVCREVDRSTIHFTSVSLDFFGGGIGMS